MKNKKKSLTQDVYQQLKDLIIYNKLLPGDIITAGEMAERFNVSKTPVRDSLNALKHEGLVELLPQKGFLVSRVDVKDLSDLFQMRIILEGAAAEMAAKNISAEWLNSLIRLSRECQDNQENTYAFMRINYDFHMTIARGAENQYLYKFLSIVLNQLQRVLYSDLITGDPSDMYREHQELVQCIQNRDGNNARKAVITQIEASRNRIIKAI
ncbi:DNA-binding transcriptional regulator, GntR family [Desulfotomaculum arcticum]|uniref:DNA-binding transcriptional regulator, GntR family n=2 Tax=Desulfotruncus TaxID=2867377 RepID=A0A1I2VBK8_9FIRM|nr:DNA-binding transcriptional regulator, GntR family [Desulfotomaculum arcticum] [Desulfotruncus arcticus DSM 17038]